MQYGVRQFDYTYNEAAASLGISFEMWCRTGLLSTSDITVTRIPLSNAYNFVSPLDTPKLTFSISTPRDRAAVTTAVRSKSASIRSDKRSCSWSRSCSGSTIYCLHDPLSRLKYIEVTSSKCDGLCQRYSVDRYRRRQGVKCVEPNSCHRGLARRVVRIRIKDERATSLEMPMLLELGAKEDR
jgi:hypothetical protein